MLNTPDGVFNLRTGARTDNDPKLLMARSTEVSPDPEIKTPLFATFLEKTFRGDDGKKKFIQKRLGYTYSGLTSYEDFDFWHGGGGNEKGTLINASSSVLGEYHQRPQGTR